MKGEILARGPLKHMVDLCEPNQWKERYGEFPGVAGSLVNPIDESITSKTKFI